MKPASLTFLIHSFSTYIESDQFIAKFEYHKTPSKLANILNSKLQLPAQVELDNILGSPKPPTFLLPTFEDRSALPYIDALIREIVRYMPPVPGGIPHALMENDVYRGFKIPKGAYLIPNVCRGMNLFILNLTHSILSGLFPVSGSLLNPIMIELLLLVWGVGTCRPWCIPL